MSRVLSTITGRILSPFSDSVKPFLSPKETFFYETHLQEGTPFGLAIRPPYPTRPWGYGFPRFARNDNDDRNPGGGSDDTVGWELAPALHYLLLLPFPASPGAFHKRKAPPHPSRLTPCHLPPREGFGVRRRTVNSALSIHHSALYRKRPAGAGLFYVGKNYSLVRLPFLARVLLYRNSSREPMTPAEMALQMVAVMPWTKTRLAGSL